MSPPSYGDWMRDKRAFVYPAFPQQRTMTLSAFHRPIRQRSELGGPPATGVFAQGNTVSSYLATTAEQQPNSYFFPDGPDPIDEPPASIMSNAEAAPAKWDFADNNQVKVPPAVESNDSTKEVIIEL